MKKKSKPKANAEARDLATIVIKIKRTFRDDICNIIRRGELLQQGKDQIEDGGWLTGFVSKADSCTAANSRSWRRSGWPHDRTDCSDGISEREACQWLSKTSCCAPTALLR